MDVDCDGPLLREEEEGATAPLVAATRADVRRSCSGGSSPPLCAEGGSCAVQRSTEPEDRQSKWEAPWRPEGARGATGGSHGRLRGRQYSSPGGGVAGWRRRSRRHHHQVPSSSALSARGRRRRRRRRRKERKEDEELMKRAQRIIDGGSSLSSSSGRRRKKKRRGRESSRSPLLVCGYDAVGKGSALALLFLVRSVPFC